MVPVERAASEVLAAMVLTAVKEAMAGMAMTLLSLVLILTQGRFWLTRGEGHADLAGQQDFQGYAEMVVTEDQEAYLVEFRSV